MVCSGKLQVHLEIVAVFFLVYNVNIVCSNHSIGSVYEGIFPYYTKTYINFSLLLILYFFLNAF